MQVEATGSSKTAVTGAIRTAAQVTGASFNYLLATAKVESDLNPNLTMRSSTATGLFQFLDQTWLGTLKQAGPALGYGGYAAAITQTPSGRYEVADPAMRREILQLRKDPVANAVMGGAFTQQNAAVMTPRIGRVPTETELYIGHFFGPYAGAKAINLATSQPNANAAQIFPDAAQSNQPIFYDRQGNARSIAGVCAELTRRYQAANASMSRVAPSATVAEVTPRPPAALPIRTSGTPLPSPAQAAVVATWHDLMFSPTLPAAMAFDSEQAAAANMLPANLESLVPRQPSAHPDSFRSLFQSTRGAVSPVVAELWSTPRESEQPQSVPAPGSPASAKNQGRAAGGSALDLFRETPASVRALFGGKS